MDFGSDPRNETLSAQGVGKMAMMPTVEQRLAQRIAEAEQQLADMKRAQELFQKNPDLKELLSIMQRTHF